MSKNLGYVTVNALTRPQSEASARIYVQATNDYKVSNVLLFATERIPDNGIRYHGIYRQGTQPYVNVVVKDPLETQFVDSGSIITKLITPADYYQEKTGLKRQCVKTAKSLMSFSNRIPLDGVETIYHQASTHPIKEMRSNNDLLIALLDEFRVIELSLIACTLYKEVILNVLNEAI